MGAKIVSTGSYLPENVVGNDDLKQFPAATLPLIEQKTGVKTRRHAAPGQCTSDLAAEAGARCLEAAGMAAADLDAIILATSSPDRIQPATATRVQTRLGAARAYAFDVNSVCTGGIYALHVGDALISSGLARRVLVIASEVYSRYLNPRDFSTYPYFGDGAGAVLLGADGGAAEIVAAELHSDGGGADVIQVPGGGTMLPFAKMSTPAEAFFRMVGREVYEFAVTRGTEVIRNLLCTAGVSVDAVNAFVLHQANINIIRNIASNLGTPNDRFVINLDRYGNTAAASVLIALDECMRSGCNPSGGYVVMAAFGGGLSWGANLIHIG